MFTKEVKASANAELDRVLELLCELLQIPPSLWEDAKEKYRAAGEWLADGSVLNALKPDIKYQGSALIETVVRPWQREEFDIDLLCILDASSVRYPNPGTVYDLVANRLAEHKTYRRLMTRKERCIALGYFPRHSTSGHWRTPPDSRSKTQRLDSDRSIRVCRLVLQPNTGDEAGC